MNWFESVEHTFLFIGGLATAFGLFRGVKAWRKEQADQLKTSIIADSKLDELLGQFNEDSSSSFVNKFRSLESVVMEHIHLSEAWMRDNAAAHRDLHRRIDRLYADKRANFDQGEIDE